MTYWSCPACHTGFYSKEGAAGFCLAWEVQSEILVSVREAAIHSCVVVFDQGVVNLRGAESFGLYFISFMLGKFS